MRLLVFLFLLLFAAPAHAGSIVSTLVRTVTNCTDADPNTAGITETGAGTWLVPSWSPEYPRNRQNAKGWIYWYDHATASQTLTLTWWAYDTTADVWVVANTKATLAIRTLDKNLDLGPLRLYPQIASCSQAIGAGVKVYAASR